MKSLRESLFDIEKNVTKDITFGDLFMLDHEASDESLHFPISQEFSIQRLKRLVKCDGDDNDERIFNGFVKYILDIEFDSSTPDRHWFIKKLNFCRDIFRSGWAKVFYIKYMKNNRLYSNFDNILDGDFDTIQIVFGCGNLNLVFRRV